MKSSLNFQILHALDAVIPRLQLSLKRFGRGLKRKSGPKVIWTRKEPRS